jgi:hypothetical protein
MSATALATRDLFGVPFADTIARWAILSRCGAYRFTLTQTWSSEGGHVCFIGLNPSAADHQQDDPTGTLLDPLRPILGLRRVHGACRKRGCGPRSRVVSHSRRACRSVLGTGP